MPRMEDRIRKLCSELLAKRGDEELGPIFGELRHALHQHIENLRERFGAYPLFLERRSRNDFSPPPKPQEDAGKETGPADASI
jgi:hypothetical protein